MRLLLFLCSFLHCVEVTVQLCFRDGCCSMRVIVSLKVGCKKLPFRYPRFFLSICLKITSVVSLMLMFTVHISNVHVDLQWFGGCSHAYHCGRSQLLYGRSRPSDNLIFLGSTRALGFEDTDSHVSFLTCRASKGTSSASMV